MPAHKLGMIVCSIGRKSNLLGCVQAVVPEIRWGKKLPTMKYEWHSWYLEKWKPQGLCEAMTHVRFMFIGF